MEPRELDHSNKTWAPSASQRQTNVDSNGGRASPQRLQFCDGESVCRSPSSFTNEQNPSGDKDADSIDNPKQRTEQRIIIGDFEQYRGLSTLKKLAKTARAASSISGNDKGNLYQNILTEDLNCNSLNNCSNNFFGGIKITANENVEKDADSEVSVDTLSPSLEKISAGPLTRGARKTLEAALAKSMVHQVPSTIAMVCEVSKSSTPPPLVVAVSSPSIAPYINSECVHRKSLPSSSPLSSSLSTACQCSPTAPSLSSPQLPSSLFDMSNSFFTNHMCPHHDDDEGERVGNNRSPSTWRVSDKKVPIENDLDDQDDMVNFITDSISSSVCANIDDDELNKNGSDSEWVRYFCFRFIAEVSLVLFRVVIYI